MENIQSHLGNLQLQLTTQKRRFNEAVKAGYEFDNLKEIKLKIKEIEQAIKRLNYSVDKSTHAVSD